MLETIQNIDFSILNFIYENIQNEILNLPMIFISTLGNKGFIFIIVTTILLFTKKYRKIGITLLISLIIGLVVVNIILKPSIARIRPYEINQSINLLINKMHDYSFPSGHTLASFEFATAIFLYNKKWGYVSFIFALLMGFSRMYLYVHFPTDVICGAILGILFSIISYHITKLIYKKFGNYKILGR